MLPTLLLLVSLNCKSSQRPQWAPALFNRGAACNCGKLQAAPKASQSERQGEQLGTEMQEGSAAYSLRWGQLPTCYPKLSPLKMKGAYVKDNEIINPNICKRSLLCVFFSATLKQVGYRLAPWIWAEGVLLSERRRLEGTKENRVFSAFFHGIDKREWFHIAKQEVLMFGYSLAHGLKLKFG